VCSRPLDLTPWACQLSAFVVAVYVYPGHECLHQQSPHSWVAYQVGLGRAQHQVAGPLVEGHDAFAAVLGLPLFLRGLVKLAGDASLLGLEQVQRDSVGVSHLHQLEPLVL
jgi:hypothetical protein